MLNKRNQKVYNKFLKAKPQQQRAMYLILKTELANLQELLDKMEEYIIKNNIIKY